MNINHLHLKVASVDRARRFYERFFGLREWVRHGEILFLRDDAGMDFALAPSEGTVQAPDGFHLGFRLESGEAVERLHRQLSDAGVAMRQTLVAEDDFVAFRCLDPDGYGVEVYWEPPPPGRVP